MIGRIVIKTFWVWHKEAESPDCELVDQILLVDNPDKWEQMKQERLDAYGSSAHSHREIEIKLDYDAVLKHWWPDPIDGEVSA